MNNFFPFSRHCSLRSLAMTLAAVTVLAVFTPSAFANVLGNTGFEQDIGDGTKENWNNDNGATRLSAAQVAALGLGFSAPPEGNFVLGLQTENEFTFQLRRPVHEGDSAVFTGRVESNIAPGGVDDGAEFVIEFKRNLPGGGDTLIRAVLSDRLNTDIADSYAPGTGFRRVTISGQAPSGTDLVVFTLRTQGADGDVLFDDMSAEINPAKLAVSASKNRVKAGDVVTIFSEFRNMSGDALNNVELVADLPRGLDVLTQSIRVNGNPATSREGSLIIPVGGIAPNNTARIAFQVLVTGGVVAGKNYEIGIRISNTGNVNLSQRASIQLTVKGDPVFDEGTVIGKVFNDLNQNGVQDKGEKGVPYVRLATEEGIVIITDENGKYHIPGVKPGRHVIKIDGHSLPQGTKFITEEAYLIKTTPGILNKANFAVLLPPSAVPEQFHEDLKVVITQGLDTSRPVLKVRMEPDILRVGLGKLEKEPSFRFKINYPEFVKTWKLEIRNEMGQEVWTGFGVSEPPAEVVWQGQTDAGLMIAPGLYSYQLKVEDTRGREDWTPLQFLRVISKVDDEAKQKAVIEIPPVGDFNIFKDGKQSIPLVAKPTLRVQGKTKPGYKLTINSRPIPVESKTGAFQTEFYTTPGEKEIVVSTTSPEGEIVSYRETVKVRDSTFFAVALGEEQMGVNFSRGVLESAGDDKSLKEGFYQDGRLSYYLKGKIKGKFLVKSHYDTSDKRSALFTNLDPDDYYPVYGDGSTRDYEGRDSLQRFYIIIEMDRSYVKWGSYQTNFTDTELSSYNRTLSGLKVNVETTATTPYGDPKRGFKVFSARSQSRGAHDEFAATGGSLYYLRNRRLVEGSEKLRVEVRDKIQEVSHFGMTIASYDLQEGKDYEIDYDEGRILLSRPLSSVAASDTLVSVDILDGNPVYLVADYEFDSPASAFENENSGLRGYTHVGDHLKLGATVVEEQRLNEDYDLRGIDATLKIGRSSKITAEYAESKLQQVRTALSYNGGLSFVDTPMIGSKRDEREGAFVIKAESKPMKNLETSAYVQKVQPGFSNDRIRLQEGIGKYGVAAKYRITDYFHLRYRYDTSEIVSQLRPFFEKDFGSTFEKTKTHVAQAIYDDQRWLAQAEYQRQNTDFPGPGEDVPSLLSIAEFDDVVAGKIGYHLNERLLPYVKVQTIIHGKANHQYGGGVRYQVTKDFYAYMEEMIGNLGDSTFLGFEKIHDGKNRSYANVRMIDRGIGNPTLSTTMGNAFALTEKSRVFSERQHSTYLGEDGYADILGYEGKKGDHWGFESKFERRNLDSKRSDFLDGRSEGAELRNNTSNAASGAVSYADGDKFKARTSLEGIKYNDAPELYQWVTRNSVQYQISQDLSYLGKLDFGKSRFTEPGNTSGLFMELSTGVAYRPVDFDRLNVLTRYTYVKDIANDLQFQTELLNGLETDETSHIISIDLAYDIFKYLQVVEKIAYKRGIFETAETDPLTVGQFLWAHRFNFHVTRKWDVAAEYHLLMQSDTADNFRHGALAEIDREFYEYVRLGLGYNFTDFDDDLRSTNKYDSHGPYVRLTGKF
ncbi:MAG: hypothetical protein HYZ83_01595 [Candidatus Omnitrophica bacterium]|nr:hypothetical protein [Candidatus Omnitrophota bacterium]